MPVPMNRRTLLAAATAAALTSRSSSAQDQAGGETFTPEMFGAKGDSVTNDTAAFRRLAQAVNARGGGTIMLRRCTYLVGLQNGPMGKYSFAPASPMSLTRCNLPLSIVGNGATLKCVGGLRYGTFDPRTGERFDHPMPFTQPGSIATPYEYMISIQDCTGPVLVRDLELDGSVESLRIGGQWGDTGWQIAAVGLFMADNTGGETVSDVHAHHHAQDGVILRAGPVRPGQPSRTFSGLRCEFNGRQGCSLIGGGGYVFRNCRFAKTGMVKVRSAPTAGLDIEAEGAPIRNVRFFNCDFSDNVGVGMVADSGDSEDVRFEGCRFVGSANWAAWPRKPLFRFKNCQFIGPIVNCWTDDDPQRATQFHRCTFANAAPSQSGTSQLKTGPIADLAEGKNVLFSGCRFSVSAGWALPWSTAAIYENCTMTQIGGGAGYPRGTYRGVSVIRGNVDLYNSRIAGKLTLNGRVISPTAK